MNKLTLVFTGIPSDDVNKLIQELSDLTFYGYSSVALDTILIEEEEEEEGILSDEG